MEYRHSGMSYSAAHRPRSFIRRHRLRHYRLLAAGNRSSTILLGTIRIALGARLTLAKQFVSRLQ